MFVPCGREAEKAEEVKEGNVGAGQSKLNVDAKERMIVFFLYFVIGSSGVVLVLWMYLILIGSDVADNILAVFYKLFAVLTGYFVGANKARE
ncbi:hypothetical protein JCM17961_13730 [Endothiovibrio diazotrophicus]